MKITLTDGSVFEMENGITAMEVLEKIEPKLKNIYLVCEVNGVVKDLSYHLNQDAAIRFLTFEDEGGRSAYWHTTSHVMAHAVKRLYPNAKLAIGPSIDAGFYYDFDVDRSFSIDDLAEIEKEMEKIIKEDYRIERFTLPRDKAIKFMEEKCEPYKVELIMDLPENEEISFYSQGDFTDLCAGPHLLSTGKINAFKLLSVAGAYWRGSEKNKMLQRIYGISFPEKKQLNEYIDRIEEAKKRDHRKLGKELDLFDIMEEGPGFPFFLPKGMIIRNILEEYWRQDHRKRGYQEIKTPIILREELWHRSGHWDHYRENMYFTVIDDENYAIKPMNCPGGMLVYKRKLYSYKDLPLRLAELGLVHRHELSGVLHGLMRVRCFTQDDAHIFMTPEQVNGEIRGVIDLVDSFYKLFGFKYHVELSTRPENSMGTDEQWEIATNELKNAIESIGMNYKVNEGDGAFYGPKIDFHLEDSIGRKWQCGTIQLDFQMPERFDLTYIGPDGEKHRPVMIHRVVLGSIERFIAILTEHFAGAFPVWLAPVQVKILPIADKHHEYGNSIFNVMDQNNIRTEIDSRTEKIGYKIRESQLQKIPYMLILGDKEIDDSTVSVRSRKEGDLGSMTVEKFIDKILNEIGTKAL